MRSLRNLPADSVLLLGVPWDEKSSYLRGAAAAPGAIREAMHSDARHLTAENGKDLAEDERFVDAGDLVVPAGEDALDSIESAVNPALAAGARIIALGGDHAISLPLLRALKAQRGPFDILQIDAHTDLYQDYEGDLYSHACPFARVMEEGLCERLVQVGIRTLNAHQREQSRRFGTEIVAMRDFDSDHDFRFRRPVYVSIDLDGLDPAYAPGVAHHEPGGLSTREVLRLIDRLSTPIVGADIVELQPGLDLNQMTAVLAAKLAKELAGHMLL